MHMLQWIGKIHIRPGNIGRKNLHRKSWSAGIPLCPGYMANETSESHRIKFIPDRNQFRGHTLRQALIEKAFIRPDYQVYRAVFGINADRSVQRKRIRFRHRMCVDKINQMRVETNQSLRMFKWIWKMNVSGPNVPAQNLPINHKRFIFLPAHPDA